MTPDELARSVKRLGETQVRLWTTRDYREFWDTDISKPLAALIEDVRPVMIRAEHRPYSFADPSVSLPVRPARWKCQICKLQWDDGPTENHAEDCSLAAVVRAINGEGER